MEVSPQTNDALIDSIMGSFETLHRGHVNAKLLLLLIETLGHLNAKMLKGRFQSSELKGFDIFSPILKCNGLENKDEIVGVLVAYCSVYAELQPLITGSVATWVPLLRSANHEILYFRPGFYTIVSLFGKNAKVSEIIPKLLKFNLGDVVRQLWIPQWISFVNNGKGGYGRKLIESDLNIALNEGKMDFFIATMKSTIIEERNVTDRSSSPPFSFLFHKLSQRGILFSRWVDKGLYQEFSTYLLSSGSKKRDQEMDSLNFQLEILMEVVDHPETNYFEEPKLVTFLYLSLDKIYDIPCNQLHLTLGALGSTQSLFALLNMVQYLLSKFLIDTGNICELLQGTQIEMQLTKEKNQKWYKSKNNSTKLPSWFHSSILTHNPPITKSLFVYDKDDWLKIESTSTSQIVELLFACLINSLLISAKLLKEYRKIKLDPLAFDISGIEVNENTFKIEYLIKEQYMDLHLISLFSSLVLSEQISSCTNQFYEGKKNALSNDILFSSTMNVFKELLESHGTIGLHHLINFAARMSEDDLTIKSISLKLLNALLFDNDDSLARNLLQKNAIVYQALHRFIVIWDDGSEIFRPFHERLFHTEQPQPKATSVTISALLELLPNYESMLQIISEQRVQKPANRAQTQCHREKGQCVLQTSGYKFNPYSAPSFVPAKKTTIEPSKETSSLTEQPSPQALIKRSPEPWANYRRDITKVPVSSNQDRQSMFRPSIDYSTYTSAGSRTEQGQSSFAFSNISSQISVPKTPDMSSSTMFSNPWEESPSMHSTPNISKIVNTGKNYILGGHNRMKNNSRAQSIHIDDFEQT
ncbi:hypothetical protein HG535_0B05510 [Zygotorulaspora mrakii]|uniref:Uncharacterized protein n=1 Tax=Zygotorulaspora mrakii TaxID=42260 RepID=A0A7H9B0K9_ZYGMR|nr:uncharacterized protein HG535_0B05510 [Zygotorulaspora mrakii]QLG71509.1 hypothetical protein HG535_0B05510 [Zygotorulaspora mrakii]